MWPRYSTSSNQKSHFDSFPYSLCSLRTSSTLSYVFFSTLRVYQYVVYEYNDKLIQIRPKDFVHVVHEDYRSICHPKWHHHILVVSIAWPESCLLYILRLNQYLMISRPQVNLGEHCCSSQLIQQVINSRQWVFVLDSQLVQLMVINTQPWTTILLLH